MLHIYICRDKYKYIIQFYCVTNWSFCYELRNRRLRIWLEYGLFTCNSIKPIPVLGSFVHYFIFVCEPGTKGTIRISLVHSFDANVQNYTILICMNSLQFSTQFLGVAFLLLCAHTFVCNVYACQ